MSAKHTKENSFSRLLKKSDLLFIQHLLNAKPGELELEFLAMVHKDKLHQRPYEETLVRLDQAYQKQISPHIALHGNKSIFISEGISILLQNGRVKLNADSMFRSQSIRGGYPQLYCSKIHSLKENLMNKVVNNGKAHKVNSICGVFNNSVENQEYSMIHNYSITISKDDEDNSSNPSDENEIYCMNIGNQKNTKCDVSLLKFINSIRDKSWFTRAEIIDEKGIMSPLLKIAQSQKVGVKIQIQGLNNKNIFDKISMWSTGEFILIFTTSGSIRKLNNAGKVFGFTSNKIGKLIKYQKVIISGTKKTVLSLKISSFDFYKSSFNSVYFTQTPVVQSETGLLKIKEKKNYSSVFIEFFPEIINECFLWNISTKRPKKIVRNIGHGFSNPNSSDHDSIVVTFADNDYYTSVHPRLSGKLTVTNAVRQLACCGAKPLSISIQNVFPEVQKDNDMSNGIEILKGQEEAVRALGLKIAHRNIISYENFLSQNVTGIGVIQNNQNPLHWGFKKEGDFISLLGSHRGELGSTKFLRKYFPDCRVNLPNVDLRMEPRIHKTIRKGINDGIVHSACCISAGGLAVAIGKSLIDGEDGLGARIQLSRKIRNDELLFGETQGLILLSFGENNLIEFERICMKNQIPATTIGRVTGNGKFTFNKLLNVKVRDLKKQIRKK